MSTSFWNRRFLSLRVRDIAATLLFYVIFAILYYITLWVNRAGYRDAIAGDPLFSLFQFFDASGLHYIVMLLITIPVWYLNFRVLRDQKLLLRLATHVITLPLFVYVSQQVYYEACELFELGHLTGPAQVWDIYIPGLFYLVQFGVFHGYEYFRDNQRKLKLEGELRQAALKSELSAIKAQLNPHFLYNVFNTINASVPAENEKTRQMIAQLSDLFRYQLQASKKELVTLGDELSFVRKYLDLEKERFGERLTVEVNVSDELYSEKIPPMILQPLVENSVKHGLSSLIEGGTISITIFKEDEKLKFEIADTGVGSTNKKALFEKGVGLTNTRLRLQKMYKSQLEINDNHPRGLKVTFAI